MHSYGYYRLVAARALLQTHPFLSVLQFDSFYAANMVQGFLASSRQSRAYLALSTVVGCRPFPPQGLLRPREGTHRRHWQRACRCQRGPRHQRPAQVLCSRFRHRSGIGPSLVQADIFSEAPFDSHCGQEARRWTSSWRGCGFR